MLVDWDFMPGYDLMRYFERYVKLMKGWIGKAGKEVDYCFIDSSGDIRESIKLEEIKELHPDLVIALQRKRELEPIPGRIESQILKLPVPEEVRRKSSRLRKRIRNERLQLYFQDSNIQTVECQGPFDYRHKVVGLYSQERFLGSGIATNKGANRLEVTTPVMAKIDRVEFGIVDIIY